MSKYVELKKIIEEVMSDTRSVPMRPDCRKHAIWFLDTLSTMVDAPICKGRLSVKEGILAPPLSEPDSLTFIYSPVGDLSVVSSTEESNGHISYSIAIKGDENIMVTSSGVVMTRHKFTEFDRSVSGVKDRINAMLQFKFGGNSRVWE